MVNKCLGQRRGVTSRKATRCIFAFYSLLFCRGFPAEQDGRKATKSRAGIVYGSSLHRRRAVGPCREPVAHAKGDLYVERFAHFGKAPIGRHAKAVSRAVLSWILYKSPFRFFVRMLCAVAIGYRDESN